MNVKRMMSATAALVAGWSGLAIAATANSPLCSTDTRIISTTYYYCSGSSHTAVDIGIGGGCSEWNHRAMLVGSYYYKYYGGCAGACSGSDCNGGAGNYYVVTGANGWDFRQLHLNANISSASKTCDGCALGLLGGTGSATEPLVHADNRQYGTRKSAWYTSTGLTCGSLISCGNIIGYPTL